MLRIFFACTRLCLLVFLLSAGLSLIVSLVCSSPDRSAAVWNARWDALSTQTWTPQLDSKGHHYLIDRLGASSRALNLPEGCLWGMISISPWTGPEGTAEAVGPCHRTSRSGAEAFCGLARIELAKGKILEEIPLDLLPTGRPCWVPERPGRIVFAAGDGQLYAHDFPTGRSADQGARLLDLASTAVEPRPLAWRCQPPGDNVPYIIDPFWPSDVRLRNLVVAGVIPPANRRRQGSTDLTTLWWFEMEPDGTAIRNAGVLLEPDRFRADGSAAVARFPVITASPKGDCHLVYLARTPGSRTVRLETISVELDGSSREPRIRPDARPVVLGDDAVIAPPVVGADERSIFYLSAKTGRPVTCRLGPKADADLRGKLALSGPRR